MSEITTTNRNAATIQIDNSQTKGLRVRSSVKGGGIQFNHAEAKGLRVRTSVKGGPGSGAGGVWLNHSEAGTQRRAR